MIYVGVTRTNGTCVICKVPFGKGIRVYHDTAKPQGQHLVHEACWDTLRASRPRQIGTGKPKATVTLSVEELDPPFQSCYIGDMTQALDDPSQMQFLQLLFDSGCKFIFRTELFGKDYVWMKDRFGSIFLERLPVEEPTEVSVNGQTGEAELVER